MEDDTFIELHEHHRALEQEFANLQISPEDTPDQLRVKARSFAINHLQDAFDALSDLLNSSKDASRLAAAKTIINIAFQTTNKDEESPLEELFKSLAQEGDNQSASNPIPKDQTSNS